MIRISESWMELKPNEDANGNKEWFNDYNDRIKSKRDFKHIPTCVFEQWIHPHHKNDETLRNYAWLNYKNIDFVLCEWTIDQLLTINVIDDFRDYYESRSSYDDFKQFCCTKEDLHFWKINGTWKTPPIILDVNSLVSKIPEWSEIKPPYQLVEGHSRLGYLKSMKRISDSDKGEISQKHKVFLMKEINIDI